MDDPSFIYDKNYYFKVNEKCIYGKKKYSREYFHELSHYKDYSNKIYEKIHYVISVWTQFIFQTSITIILLSLFGDFNKIISQLPLYVFIAVLPMMIWTFQEELRADINSYIWRFKWRKQNDKQKRTK